MPLDLEYESLRGELLQLYTEQSTLTFISGITSAAIVFGILQTSIPIGLAVLVWHLILVGITWKLISNYNRIYRLGGYLKIVHEQKAEPNYIPTPDHPAWHYRTRLIGKGSSSWKWGSGARIDARFLRLLGFVGLLLVILSVKLVWPPNRDEVIWAGVALLSFIYLWFQTKHLFTLRKESEEFELALWRLIAEHSPATQKMELPS